MIIKTNVILEKHFLYYSPLVNCVFCPIVIMMFVKLIFFGNIFTRMQKEIKLTEYLSYMWSVFSSVHTADTFFWTKVEPWGKSPCPRRRQCCCMVGDRIILFGGTRWGRNILNWRVFCIFLLITLDVYVLKMLFTWFSVNFIVLVTYEVKYWFYLIWKKYQNH